MCVNGIRVLQWQLSQTINQFDDVKFEAASVLAELYEQQQQSSLSQSILRKAIELSQHNVYWHCRLIFQLAVSFISSFACGRICFGIGMGGNVFSLDCSKFTRPRKT